MKRVLAATAIVAAVLAGNATAAGSQASCVGLVTSWEATTLPAGSLGAESSGLAGPGFGSFVRELAHGHPGSLSGCAG